MKKITVVMFLSLFFNVLLSMEEAREKQATTQKISKAKKRKLRRNLAQQAQREKETHAHGTACHECNQVADSLEKACVFADTYKEKYTVKVVFDLDFPPASFEEHTRHAKVVEDVEHHCWHPCSWEIPEYAFACWTERRDEALALKK